MDEKSIKLLLDNNLLKFNSYKALPSYYNPKLLIPKKMQMNIEYLAQIIYPSNKINREKFIDACQLGILRIKKKSNIILEEHTSNRQWDRVDSCLRKGTKKLTKVMILWQAYEDYTEALKLDKKKYFTFDQYIIRNVAFYCQREKDYLDGLKADDAFSGEFKKMANIFTNVEADFVRGRDNSLRGLQGARIDAHEMAKPYLRDFKDVKKVIHLLQGYYLSLKLSGYNKVPHLLYCIKDPEWVTNAIKISQYKIYDIIINNKKAHDEDKRVIELPIKKMDFVFMEHAPLFPVKRGLL
ncbi:MULTISPECIES: hypothetical protein [unclassified Pseudoalteromonas]|uniref:hypothetical protein n=1 Tax=unclassified Pseudoalteromonas TaxID=194690 RepID=UPI00040DD2D1|nr:MULTISPECIES: hypothetical protein [unclassified Pseudoalteromonas]